MFCPKCGKQLADSAKFCTGCGAQVGPVNGNVPINGNGQKKEAKRPQSPKPPKQPKPSGQTNNNGAGIYPSGLPAQVEMSQKTKETENKNKRIMVILSVILIVLILVAVGMAVYYFKSVNGGGDSNRNQDDIRSESDNDDGEQTEEQEPDADADDKTETDASDTDVETAEEEAEPEEPAVVSDTNEVVKNTILPDIPKALYSYEFEDTLGNARVVVREVPETMPEVTADVTPQYVNGMDGKAVYLDGTYGIRLDDVSKIGTSYTIAFWMKADAYYDWAPFIHIGYDLLDASRKSRLWLCQKTDGVSVAPILSSERAVTGDSYEIRPEDYAVNKMDPGIWYHIVFTVDGNTKGSRDGSLRGTLYVSGRYAGEGDIVLDTMNVNNLDVYLGINCWDILYPVAFDGVKIWDTVLDSQQVGELFDAYQ